MLFHQNKIHTRILAAFVIIIVIMSLMSGFMLFVHLQMLSMYNRTLQNIITEYTLTEATDNLIQHFNQRLQDPDNPQLITGYTNAQRSLQHIFTQMDAAHMNQESRIAYDGLKNMILHIQSRCEQGFDAYKTGNVATTEDIYNDVAKKYSYVVESTADLIMFELKFANEQQARLKRVQFIQLGLLLLCIIVVSAVCLYYAVVFTKKLTRPLKQLAVLAAQVGNENFDIEVDSALLKRQDEIGDLAMAFNAMRENLRRTISRLNEEIRIRKEAELSAEHANRAKSSFLANMNHELRTPMNAIIGYTSLLEDGQFSPEQQEFMKSIRHSSEALLSIINNILDISKIEAGKMTLEKHPFSLREQMERVISVITYQTEKKGLSLTCDIDKNIPEFLLGDATRFFQILTNLMNNAVKFTEQGGITLTVQDEKRAHTQQHLIHCIVKDTGIGIDPARLDAILDPFEQADASHTRRFGGTGLGLSISKSLCELMGGALEIDSRPNQGSTFHFSIHLSETSFAQQEEQTPTQPSPLPPERTPKILLADDDETGLALTTFTLKKLGYPCDTVTNGQQVIEAVITHDYDIIFMDIQMPGMDGLEATQVICEIKKPPPWIIGLTANATIESQADCIEAGMMDYLAKPVKRADLLGAIQTAMQTAPRAGA